MSVATGDILRVVASMIWSDGNIMQNVFNATVSGAGGPWTEDDILDDAEAWLDNMYANITADVVNLVDGQQFQVYKYDSVGLDWDEVGTQGWTWNPSSLGEQMARGVAALVRGYTTNADVFGKKYIGGLSEAQLVLGLWNATIATDGLAFAVDWITAFVGGTSAADWTPGIWSPKNLDIYDFITSYAITLIPAYQRRRKRGVGA